MSRRGADRCRARRAGKQRELSDDRARAEHAQHLRRPPLRRSPRAGRRRRRRARPRRRPDGTGTRPLPAGRSTPAWRAPPAPRRASSANSGTARRISRDVRGPAGLRVMCRDRRARPRGAGDVGPARSAARRGRPPPRPHPARTTRPSSSATRARPRRSSRRRTSSRGRRRRRPRPGRGVPMIATRIETPSTAPSWRATELSPWRSRSARPGHTRDGRAPTTGNVIPAPIPSITIAGSHS